MPGGETAPTSDGEADEEPRTIEVTMRLLELTIKATNHLQIVEEFLGLFHERFVEGVLCRDRTLKML
jgi:hypothetical protein